MKNLFLSTRHIQSALLLFLLNCGVCHSNLRDFLPYDGKKLVASLVNGYIPESTSDNSVWNLKNLYPISDNFTIEATYVSDSILSVRFPALRYDYRISGDTLFRLTTESRVERITDTIPLAVFIDNNCPSALPAPVGRKGRRYQSDSISEVGFYRISSVAGGTVILPQGDTIKNIKLYVSEESYPAHSITTYSWTTGDILMPLLPTTAVSKVNPDGSISDCDPISWMQVLEDMLPEENSEEEYITPDSPDEISINMPRFAKGDTEVILYDISGKIYQRLNYPGESCSGSISICISDLPQGTYCVTIINGNERTSKKFTK